MQYKTLFSFSLIFLFSQLLVAQTTTEKDTTTIDTTNLPVIEYSTQTPKYEIAGIKVTGADNYEDFVLIGFSGLAVGDIVNVPGDAITNAVKRFWKQGLFSDVKILANKIKDGKVWLTIELKQRPRVSEINYNGLKKSEIDDLDLKIGIVKGNQITPDISDRAKKVIEKFMEEKGFLNVLVNVYQRNDPGKPGHVIVDINVDKKLKTKIHQLIYTGNVALNHNQINRVMKKTNDNNWRNFFRTKKFVKEEYEKDKQALIDKYNEIGYRDAYIVSDSVVPFDNKSVNVYIKVDEGKKYYFGNIKWIGNTIYPYEFLDLKLGIKKGDVYNHKLLMERLETDENTAVSKLYKDRGYLFFQIDPVEVQINNDSIDFEMRMYEGKPATINEIRIKGNTRVYEHVVRRELRTKPGQLYSQEDIMRSLRELAQMGHFDPEKITPDIQPNQENGTVDINYNLETKGSDQIEFSAGWGSTGVVGSIGLKFSNFAIQNLFRPETYRIVPQGEGQTFTLNGRTNGQSYSSVSMSFLEPWLGGKRPNSLSASVYYSTQSAVSDRYSSYNSSYLNSMYNYGGYGGSSYGSSYNSGASSLYQSEMDPEKYMRTIGASIGYGKRLNWPDDYFVFQAELSYQLFMLKKWYYLPPLTDGNYNNFSLNLTLSRSSIDNPIYTRSGSAFSLGLKITPPYSALNGKDYADPNMTNAERYKWIEYHKWTFSGKTFIPLSADNKLVLMGRVMFAYLGDYNKNARSPYETFIMGGDGMSNYSSYGSEYVAMRGYSSGSLTPYDSKVGSNVGYLYDKFTMELRYPLSLEQSATIYALTFVEAGNCFNKMSDYNPFDLKRTAGVGVRIFLPMFGMMGIDWGYGFDKDKVNGTIGGSQFHFVLGQEL
ncbi:MAG: outer membrane protein assembly factor BamA [Paludibacter sp.]|jgi:outer membrane protein insertion porin family|nr:outer membrane protein assembly factor BamA [Paludibacter sp.]